MEQISKGEFLPDETRSGRWVSEPTRLASPQEGKEAGEGEAECSDEAESVAESVLVPTEVAESSSSTSSSASSGTDSEQEEEVMMRQLEYKEEVETSMPEEGLWRHPKYGTFHRGPKEGKAKVWCGRAELEGLVKCDAWPKFAWPRCRICFK